MAALVVTDQTSTTGRNLKFIEKETRLNPLCVSNVRLKEELTNRVS